jgi:hypothetical protein
MGRTHWPFLIALFGACGHEAPYEWTGPAPHGPISVALPRRLTFNPGDDRNPSVTAGTLVFSRLALDRGGGRERCLAFLPAEGGTLRGTVCPPPPSASPADTFIDTWVEPALSPDGQQIAFVWQQGAPASYYTWTRDLVIAPVLDPSHPTFRWQAWYVLPDGRIATAVSKTMWLGPTSLRFLASYERVFKVKGGGAGRLTDTVIDVFSLLDLDLATGQARVVPGADSAIAYAPAPAGGGVWLVKSSDSTQLLLLAQGVDTAVPIATFSGPVADLTNVSGVPVALFSGGLLIEWIDLTTGVRGNVGSATPISRVVAVPGTRLFVAEVEKTGTPLAPDGANFWLFGIP